MKQIVAVGIILILFAVGLSGCTQEDALSGLGYSNRYYGFGLNPPKGWTVQGKNTSSATVASFLCSSASESEVKIIIFEPATLDGETLDSGVELTLGFYSNALPNYSLISENARSVNGMNAYEIVFNCTNCFYVENEELEIKIKEVFVEKNGMVFIIHYSATPDAYDTYLSIVEQSINSFTIV